MTKTAVVVPNWNGKTTLGACLDSLIAQSYKTDIIVVDNGSNDGSLEFIEKKYPDVIVVSNKRNLGFAGGVNSGINKAFELGSEYIALFNNDAVADKDWLAQLVKVLETENKVGIVTCKLVSGDGRQIDSTGDLYTNWGLPFPRGRGEESGTQYDNKLDVFAASGGASLYRTSMLKKIGLFDKDFFAYYEDVDISFRAQLAGWKVRYSPKSLAYHETGTTSGQIKGFTTYQAMKNLPWLFWKNVPMRYLFIVGWRFNLSYIGFYFSAISRGQFWPATKGLAVSFLYSPKKLVQRWRIQSSKKVTSSYIWNIMTHDLPSNARDLRKIRSKWWKLTGKGE
jgi:GT2 family glycosyltransferase